MLSSFALFFNWIFIRLQLSLRALVTKKELPYKGIPWLGFYPSSHLGLNLLMTKGRDNMMLLLTMKLPKQ